MPNASNERDAAPREAPIPGPGTRQVPGPGTRPTGRRAPATVGLIVAVGLIAVAVGGGLAGGFPGGSFAAASPDPSAAAAATVAPPTPDLSATAPAASPTPTANPTPSPTASAPASPAPTPSPDPATVVALLDARLDDLRERTGIPGASVAILWDDGRRWLGAAGSANLAAKQPMTTGTAFALASVSKTLTAAVVLQLVEDGKLSLDQPVARLLPGFGLDAGITVRMLLDHTSGLPDFFLNPKIDGPLLAKPDATWTPARTWAYVPPKRQRPGTAWTYSNTNYLLLGELVEAVSGRTLAAEVRRRLLDPLDLRTAWYQAVEKPRAGGAIGYRSVAKSGGGTRFVAVARASGVLPFRSVVTAAGGAGSIAATAMDAALWMRAFAGGRVLGAEMQQAMIEDAALTKAMGARVAYGLGIEVVTLDGRTALGHSGRYLGFRSVVLYLPDAGITIAVLTNQSAYDPAKIAALLLRIAAPPPVVAPSAAPSSSASPAPAAPAASP